MAKFEEINLREINLRAEHAARQVRGQQPQLLLILGASARAACQSALRAGMRPIAADLFADRDLQSTCRCRRVNNTDSEWLTAAEILVPDQTPWLYTGAFENRPQLVEQIAQRLELWGTPGHALSEIRDPLAVAAALDAADLPSLQVQRSQPQADTPHDWLMKPLLGSAGSGIQAWRAQSSATGRTSDAHHGMYFQQHASGHAMSAVFLTDGQSTCLVGTTSQIIGCAELGGSQFGYCGSIGPLQLPEPVTHQLGRIGAALVASSSLRGLFGIDLIYDGRDAWVTEVNPRYTASVEVLERALNVPLLAWHRWACSRHGLADRFAAGVRNGQSQIQIAQQPAQPSISGKLILYAQQQLIAPEIIAAQDADGYDTYCDLPQPGQSISGGHPVCSVMASGQNRSNCSAELIHRLQTLLKLWKSSSIDVERLRCVLLDCPFSSG